MLTTRQTSVEGLAHRIAVRRPGLRQYVGATEIPRVLNGLGVSVLSTPEGLMTGTQARKKDIGGELLFNVW